MSMGSQRLLNLCLPALAGLVLAIVIAMVLGGPIAGAIAGFVFGSAFIVSLLLAALLLAVKAPGSRGHLLLAGLATYLTSIIIVLALWSLFGPSQIM